MAQTTQNQGRRSRGFSPADDLALQAPQATPPEGGKIKGPGTGTSDSIPDEMRAGTFIMPADSTKTLGAEALKRLANTPAAQGNFTQEQAHAAGIAFLTSLRDATHKPVTDPDGDADTEGLGDVDDGSERNFADGGGVGDRPVMGGYRYSELPTADEINSAVGAKEQAEQQKLAQLQGTQIKDPFSWQAQAKAADIKAGQKNLANLQSARAVGNKQLQFGPGAGKLAGDSQGNAGAFALAEALQESKGMRVMGRPGDAGSVGPAKSPLQLNSDGTVQHSSGKFAKGFSVPQQFARGGMVKPQDRVLLGKGGGGGNWMLGQNGYADGGAVGCGGKKPKARGFAGGGEVEGMYRQWQDAKTPWYMPTPQGNMEERNAELAYTNALKNAYSNQPSAQPGNPIAKPEVSKPQQDQGKSQTAPTGNNQKAAADAEAEAWGQQAQTTDNLKQRLAEKGRDGMTNAEVAQANPNGVVTMKRQANGVMEFSGNNIKGPVSYADAEGNAVAGAGIRGKGFGRVDVAPAGANVAMGPNGSYAFSNDPAPSRGQQAPQSYGGFDFPGYGQQGAAPDPMAGMTVEQRLQYANEVQAAQTSTRGSQITQDTKGSKAIRSLLDARSPEGILRRNAETTLAANFGKGGAGAESAKRTLEGLTASAIKQSEGADGAAFDQRKYEDALARQQQQDAWGIAKDVRGIQKDERAYQDGAPDRQTKALQAQQAIRTAQLYDAYQNATDPKQQAAIAERLRVLTGKDKPEAWRALALSGGKDEFGNAQPGGALIFNPATGENRYVGGGQQGGQQGAARPASKAEFDALPKGAKFIDPNGQVRIK